MNLHNIRLPSRSTILLWVTRNQHIGGTCFRGDFAEFDPRAHHSCADSIVTAIYGSHHSGSIYCECDRCWANNRDAAHYIYRTAENSRFECEDCWRGNHPVPPA